MKQSKSYRVYFIIMVLILSPLLSMASDAQETYMAQSACLKKLTELNDMLHVNIYNRQANASVPVPDVEKGLFSTGGSTVTFAKSNDYFGINAQDFTELFEERFELASQYQEPFVFTGLIISDLIKSGASTEMIIGGWMSLAGSLAGEDTEAPRPFIIKFMVDMDTQGPKCSIKTFEWSDDLKLHTILDAFQGTKLHSEEFLNAERSQLVKRGLCKHYELDAITMPMKLLIEERAWEKSQKETLDWNGKEVSQYTCEASIGMAELWSALPYYRPLGVSGEPNSTKFNGDPEVDELIGELKKRSTGLKRDVQTFSTKYRDDSDLRKIEALAIRAWHNLVNEDMSKKDLFFKDVDNAAFFPQIKEFQLFKVLGYARVEDFALSQEYFERFQGNGKRSVMLYELDKIYQDIWYAYGLEQDGFNSHNESMLALYLGAIFGNDQERLLRLSAKAGKMDHPKVAINCLQRVISIDDNASKPELWYQVALAKADAKQDPAQDITMAESLSEELSVMKYCAEAKYMILEGRQAEGLALLKEASKKRKFKKTDDLMIVKAETSSNHKVKLKNFEKIISNSDASQGEKMFKLGFVEHRIADSDDLDLNAEKRRMYYKEAQYHYRRALSRGFDRALGYKKLAETYVSINELKDASNYFNKSIENQERSGAVYFAMALLDFVSNDVDNFEKNMDIVRALRIEEIGTERDQSLFRFMDTFSQLRKLKEFSESQYKKRNEEQSLGLEQIDYLTKDIQGRVLKMYALSSPQDSAYAGLCQATFQSIKGYNDMDLRDTKEYKDVNINDEEVVERMLKDSDLELYFFKDNAVLKQAADWNDIFNNSIFKKLPREKNNSEMKFLKESNTFRDTYNYL